VYHVTDILLNQLHMHSIRCDMFRHITGAIIRESSHLPP